MTRAGARAPSPVGERDRPSREPRAPRPPRPTPARYRRRRIAALLGGLVLLVGLGLAVRVVLYDSGLVDVQDVTVTGTSTVAVPDVLAAAAVSPGGPLAGVDTDGIAARVAQLPAVATVTVTRDWPHTVGVAVVERVPAATVDTPQGTGLVDTTGVVYAGTAPAGLPKLVFAMSGPDGPSTEAALAALAALPVTLRTQVETVDVTIAAPGAPEQVEFGLTEDRQVHWGTAERSPDKATVLVALLTQPGKVYDVTSPELPTIRR